MGAMYTVLLKDLMEDPETKQKIDRALSTYPLYQKKSKEEFIPSYIPTREELNKKLLNHFKYREIGFETVGRFLDELEISMNEIMPRYNLLFHSADQDFNIIYNVDYKRTIDRNQEGNNTLSSEGSSTANATTNSSTSMTDNSTNDAKKVNSATPQSELSVPSKNIDQVSYADDVTWDKASSDSKSSSTANGSDTSSGSTKLSNTGSNKETESTLETTKGNFGVVSAQHLVIKYRDSIINIEQMIFRDPLITDLFMKVF